MFEQLMQKNWFVLLIALGLPLAVGLLVLGFFVRRRRSVIRLQDQLVFLPNEVVKGFSMFMMVTFAAAGTGWILHNRYLAGAGALITAIELARWIPATVRFSPTGLSWSTPFTKDRMNWEEISCTRKRITFAKSIDDSFEIFGSGGQKLIIQQSGHPNANQMLVAISQELKRRGLVTSGIPPQESMLEWVHTALSLIGFALFLSGFSRH